MITALFLIIAFFRRKRFLTESTCWADRILYYFLNVPLPPTSAVISCSIPCRVTPYQYLCLVVITTAKIQIFK